MAKADPVERGISKKAYRRELHDLWLELVKLQRAVIADGQKLLILFEGRDAAGKDGTIRRITRHLSPRAIQVVALGKPSEREESSWYFQRYVPHLPVAGEIVLFNRSWYNRAGVERVMGFCTDAEYQEFMDDVPGFEQMLVGSGIQLFKVYLDIGKEEEKERLEARRKDPLKQWKTSSLDAKAIECWDEYTEARNMMFARTHTPFAPWTVVRADNKKLARLNVIRFVLSRLAYDGKNPEVLVYDPEIVFEYDDVYLKNGMLSS